MALKTTIAAGLAALTLSLFAGTAAEAKTRVVIGIGGGGWGMHSCWGGWRRNCGWHPRHTYHHYTPRNRIVVYTHGGNGRGRALSCGAASSIVDRNGYSGVRVSECRGDVYSFNARRNGKFYRVKVNAHTGRIIGSGRL